MANKKISQFPTVAQIETNDFYTTIRETDPLGTRNKKNSPDQVSADVQSRILPFKFISNWNANTNTPDLTAAPTKIEGHFYRVSVAGSTNLDGITSWEVGDTPWFDGSVWRKNNTSQSPEFASIKMINTFNEFSIDGTLAGDSDSAGVSEKAIKTYVDAQTAAAAEQELLTIEFDGDTSFPLSQAPSGASAFGLFVNGQLRSNPTDYTFSGTTLTWNDPGGVILKTTDELLAWYNFSAAAGGSLAQLQIYYVGKAGNDSNSGKSVELPFLTIGAAIIAAEALTPSISNQFLIQVIDGGSYDENFTASQWLHIMALGGSLTGNVVVDDDATITVKNSFEPTSGSPPRNFSKTSGTGTATINILDTFDCGIGRGMNCTSGTLVVNTVNAKHGDGYLIGDGNGISVLNSSGLITGAGGGFVALVNGNGKYDVKYNRMKSTSTSAVWGSSLSGGVLKGFGGFIDATGGGRVYQFGTANQFTLSCTGYDETNASTNIGGATLILDVKRDPNDNTIVTNTIGALYEDTQLPMFEANVIGGASNVTGDNTDYTVIWNSATKNIGTVLNTGTGVFTAPVDGTYHFDAILFLEQITSSHITADFFYVTTGENIFSYRGNIANRRSGSLSDTSLTGSLDIDLDAADTVSVHIDVKSGTKVVDISSTFSSKFTGRLVNLI